MSNKIRLNSGQEFVLVGYGLMKDEMRKEIQFRFSSNLSIGEVQAAFKDPESIERIDYILADGNIRETITDCAAYQSITQDSEGKYIVTLSTDKVSVELKHSKEALDIVKGDLQAAQIDLLTANMVLNTMLTEVIPQIIELIISEAMPEEEPAEVPEENPEEIPEE